MNLTIRNNTIILEVLKALSVVLHRRTYSNVDNKNSLILYENIFVC